MSYPVLLGAVVIVTGSNDVIRWRENATTFSATLAAGTYFLRGDGVFALPPSADFDRIGSAAASTVFGARANGDPAHRFDPCGAADRSSRAGSGFRKARRLAGGVVQARLAHRRPRTLGRGLAAGSRPWALPL